MMELICIELLHLCKELRQVESPMVGMLVGILVFATPNGTYFPTDLNGSTIFLYRMIQDQGYSSQAYLNAFAYDTTPAFLDGHKSNDYYGSIVPYVNGTVGWNVYDANYHQYFKPGVCDSIDAILEFLLVN